MKDYLNYYNSPKEKILHDGAKIFDIQLKGLEGKDVLIDEKPLRVIVRNHTNDMNEFKEERIISVKPYISIHRGNVVKFDENIYIVMSDVDDHTWYKSAKMQKITQNLKFMSKREQGTICEYPAIIDDQNKYTLGVLEKKDFTIGDGRYSIIFPANDDTLEIKVDDRFLFNNSAWKVTDVNTITQKGLVNLMLGEDRKYTSDDDIENEIADRWKYKKNEEKEPEQSKDCNYEIAQNMGFNIHRWNINTFELVKKSKGIDTPCDYEYKIDYKGLAHDCIGVKEVDNKLKIRNLKCEHGEIITITFIDKATKKEISQDIKLIK